MKGRERHANKRGGRERERDEYIRSAFAVSRARIAPDFPLSTQ